MTRPSAAGLRRHAGWLLVEWDERRLHTGTLPRRLRWLAGAGLAACLLLGLVILAEGVGWELPGGSDVLPSLGELPTAAAVCWFLGLALASALLAAASLQPGWRAAKLTLVCIGLVGASLGEQLIEVSRQYRHHDVVTVAGWVAVGAGMLLLLAPVRLLRPRPLAAAAVAALPGMLALVAYVAVGSLGLRVSPAFIAEHTTWPDVVSLRSLVLYDSVIGARGALAAAELLLLWQVVEGARATRDVGRVGGGLLRGLPLVLVVLLVAKLSWLALGYSGRLPALVGQQQEIFAHSRADGALSWALAAVLAAACVWWLRRRRPVDERGLLTGVLLIIGGLMLAPAVDVALDAARTVSELLPTDAPRAALADLADATWAVRPWATVATVYLAAVLGLQLLRRGGHGTTALVLLSFAAWSLPRALVLTRDLLRYPDPDLPVGETPDLLELIRQTAGWVDLATFDTLFTLGLVAVTVAWWRGRLPHLTAGALVATLLILTLAAYGVDLLPGAWGRGTLFYVGLCFPVAYGFLLGSDALNRPSPARPMRILTAIGVAVLAMTVVSFQVPNGAVRPGAVNAADLGMVLFKLPLAAVLVAITISPAVEPARPAPAQPGPA